MSEQQKRLARALRVLRPEGMDKDKPMSVEERMQHYGVPGISVAIVHDGQIASCSFGSQEKGQKGEVETTTLFQAASISKPIFALGVMRLVEQGVLDLDEDITTYVRSFAVPPVGSWQPRLTLRQLLSHHAGLTVHGFPGYPIDSVLPSLEQVLLGVEPANTRPVVVDLIPGLQFRYSGGGTTLAQLVVEDVVGKDLPAIMDKLLFSPLNLQTSTYGQPLPMALRAQAARGHLQSGEVVAGKWHVYPEMAAAGLWTTPSDLVRIGMEVQAALQGESELLSRNGAVEMLTPIGTSLPIADAIGTGFFLNGSGDSARFLHGGSNHGFLSRLTMYRESSRGVAIMVNSDAGRGLIDEIETAIAREFDWPGYLPLPEAKLVGTYRDEEGHEFVVGHERDQLAFLAPQQAPLRLQPYGARENCFRTLEVPAIVQFEVAAQGEVVGLQLSMGGRTTRAARDR